MKNTSEVMKNTLEVMKIMFGEYDGSGSKDGLNFSAKFSFKTGHLSHIAENF